VQQEDLTAPTRRSLPMLVSRISIVQRHSKAAVIFYTLSLDFTYHLQREALILLTTYARSAYFTYYLQREAVPSAVSKNKADITYHLHDGEAGASFYLRDGEAGAIDDDILVVAADNILDFSFKGFVDFANEKNASCIMYYEEPELKNLQRTGVIAIDENHRVLEMQEKPVAPVSNHAVPPFYVYMKKDLPLIRTSIENGCGFDAPGNLAHFLVERTDVCAYQMPGHRFDIGSLDSYERAKNLFE
jgi:NDP-sugar pyrophosphorylase family protein